MTLIKVFRNTRCYNLLEEQVPLEDLVTREDLIVSRVSHKGHGDVKRVTRNKTIKMCKVQWSHHIEDEATCEQEEDLRR
jgi:hypothetical protein